jgi:hypothetical protein
MTDAVAMATWVLLTRVPPEAAADPGQLAALGDLVAERLKAQSFPASDAPAFAPGVQHKADAPAEPTH